jgi:putative ABC transport system permease protein
MRALDQKLLRDLKRLRAQALAVALVVAGGVATLILAVGSFRSLQETRLAYYDRYQFADVFASVKRAPKSVLNEIASIRGVSAVEGRIAKLVIVEVPGVREPINAEVISIPDSTEPLLNRLYLRSGRMPEQGRADEVVVNDGFAKAHRLVPGDRFAALLNGRERQLVIVGTALSPEFVYTIGPGDRAPDEGRFGVVWIREQVLASAYDLDGAFSSVSLRLRRGAQDPEVIRRVDDLLDSYGGQAAYGRKDQTSDAYLDHGLAMLRNMSETLPPIFLLVSVFLINLTLSRIVALEREQIGLLKALGYRSSAIAWHYCKFVILIVAVGIILGSAAGTWLGVYLTRLYGNFYRFPFLVFVKSPDLHLIAAALSILAASTGALRALREVIQLPPAIAMQPPAPPRFRRLLPRSIHPVHLFSQTATMMVRNLTSHPLRAVFTTLGMALATAILVASLFLNSTMDQLIDVTYFLADRQDVTVSFIERRPANVVQQVAHLPGVLLVESYRDVPVRIRHGAIERRIILSGRPRDADLRRIIGADLRPVVLPKDALAISGWLARTLGVHVGDSVEVDLLEGQRRTVSLPIAALVEDYFGIQGMMDFDALGRLMREAPSVSSVNLTLDSAKEDGFFQAIRRLPSVTGTVLQRASLANFRAVIAVLVTTMAGIYTGLAAVIAFGVVYNSTRISLSERARELASLRVLGFREAEVLRILLADLTVITLVAQPLGWVIGYGLAGMLETNMAGELMRAPLIVDRSTYILASALIVCAAAGSALLVRERIKRLDLVAVLKTRE